MSIDTAEPAIAHRASDISPPGEISPGGPVGADREGAGRDVWRALWISRLVVWLAGSGVVATLGFGPVRHAFNPPGITRGFGALGDVLAAPVARWDAAWYLVI